METFYKLFGSLLSFVYHCFDRMVILAYLPLLTREENIVHFFRDVNGIWPLTQEALRERTNRYRGWVDSYAADHGIPIEWAEKGVRKEDHVAPSLQRMRRKNQFGVYYILRSMEVGPTFRSFQPRYPVEDPDYRILRRRRSRYTHFYFYIHDPVLGALSLCIGSFSALPDQLLSQRPFLYRARTDAPRHRLPQERQCLFGGRRSRGAAADCRQLQCGAHPASARLLD